MAEPILDLDVLTQRRTVRIFGVEYDLLNPDELTIVQDHKLAQCSRRAQALKVGRDDNPTEADVEEIAKLLDSQVRLVLQAPSEVIDRLTDTQKQRVFRAFLGLWRSEAQLAGGTQPAPESPSTGASSSHDSSASMVALP